jgi:hypothetical protein
MDPVNVVKGTHHALNSCPCSACVRERKRRDIPVPSSEPRLINVSPKVAYLFRYISRLNPHGSLARQISKTLVLPRV